MMATRLVLLCAWARWKAMARPEPCRISCEYLLHRARAVASALSPYRFRLVRSPPRLCRACSSACRQLCRNAAASPSITGAPSIRIANFSRVVEPICCAFNPYFTAISSIAPIFVASQVSRTREASSANSTHSAGSPAEIRSISTPSPLGKHHLGRGHGDSALGHVAGRFHQFFRRQRLQQILQRFFGLQIQHRRRSPELAQHVHRIFGRAKFGLLLRGCAPSVPASAAQSPVLDRRRWPPRPGSRPAECPRCPAPASGKFPRPASRCRSSRCRP